MDIRDVSSIMSNEKGHQIVSLTEECMIDNTFKLDGPSKVSRPDLELDFSIAESSSYSSNSSDSPASLE